MKKHQNIDSRIPARDAGYIHLVRLPWIGQSGTWWNEACADIMDVFGLPGGRFTSHPTVDCMDFYFKSEKDYHLCKILLSDKI
jgi:hypothetical protein